MDRRAAALLTAAFLTVACSRTPARAPALVPFASEAHGFRISHPGGWHRVESDDGRRVWFMPTAPPAGESPETSATEFLVVMSRPDPGPLSEGQVRRLAMTLLPMHGVSGFQRTSEDGAAVAWYRFELTGSTRGIEWASLGLLVTGPRGLHYAVCAAPLALWRDRQRLCDEALRSFVPGDLQ
ncbi:MAG: hypothetical protein QN174_05920 [Armatimonadota bacterium]|nr:hypothetical protein [Armatimonadota bacterium]MDR7421975.1 hypothetical protein [Armatimonadota bacterium]MDR7456954.1 hypothetical protein [Armatimonadota bacterium]MDR7496477.1 hypothetical protein [Armatimonadota bacterium]MDR7511570.1 hypothetical protein [Armatimonadota bacterium]